MIKHIFKIIWNEHKKYFGLFLEQTLVFIILLVSIISIFDAIKKYTEPGLLNTENQVIIGYILKNNGQHLNLIEQQHISESMNVILDNLRREPFVEAITESFGFTPYMRMDNDYAQISDSVKANGKTILAVIKTADKETEKVFSLSLEEGTWFTSEKLKDGTYPAILTRQLVDKLGWKKAVGRKLNMKHTFTVIGVISGVKQEVFSVSPPSIIIGKGVLFDFLHFRECCAKIKPKYKSEFFNKFNHEFQRLSLNTNAVLMYFDMDDLKKSSMLDVIANIAMQIIPTLFLLFFTFIGTLGLSLLNSKKRKIEFATRLVIGSTKYNLLFFVLEENFILTIFASLPSIIFFLLVYEWTIVHFMAFIATLLIMILFSIFSAWYPAYKVSRLNLTNAIQEQ